MSRAWTTPSPSMLRVLRFAHDRFPEHKHFVRPSVRSPREISRMLRGLPVALEGPFGYRRWGRSGQGQALTSAWRPYAIRALSQGDPTVVGTSPATTRPSRGVTGCRHAPEDRPQVADAAAPRHRDFSARRRRGGGPCAQAPRRTRPWDPWRTRPARAP